MQDLWGVAQQLIAQRQWSAAKNTLLKLLEARPDLAQAWLQLSYVESLTGSYGRAREFALRAFRTRPAEPKDVAELIARLRTFNEAAAIESCASRLPPLRDVDIRLLLSFASQFSYLGQQKRAMHFLDEARRGDPDFPPTLVARGQVLTYLGLFDEAEDDLRRCIARAPELAQAHWLLSRLRKATSESNHVDRIRECLRRFQPSGDNLALFEYALHKELDDLGDHAQAWVALERACAAKRATLRYSAQDSRVLFEKLERLPLRVPGAGCVDTDAPVPVFIVGMHRSGTTLIEHLLARHGDVQPLGELYDFTTQMRAATDHHCAGVIDSTIVDRAAMAALDKVGPGYLAGVSWRLDGHGHFTDKLPSNFLNLGFICQALPQARIVHMVRDPMEVAFSNLRELFSSANAYSYDQRELLDYYLGYRRLMSYWRSRFPDRILDVDYAALTSDPVREVARVAEFCGIPAAQAGASDRQRTEGVATASAVQVREGVQVRRVPKWQPYADRLRLLQEGFATVE